MAHAVTHWEIGAKDAQKLTGFYRELFGWDVDASMPGYYSVAPADGGIGGGIRQAQSGVPPCVTFYVSVDDDLEPHLTKAESLGGKTIVLPTPFQNGGAFAMILDPEEHVIGLMKMPAAPHANVDARANRQGARLGSPASRSSKSPRADEARAAHARCRVPVGEE
jgi:predicted enzyme related to lactoylglutathione lyase